MAKGAPKKEETILIRMYVPNKLYAYLRQLRVQTALGASESDVATYLLTQRVEQMVADRYLEKNRIT